eukprot:scaffold8384_cov108-Isochrysis_galbana.AAC.2
MVALRLLELVRMSALSLPLDDRAAPVAGGGYTDGACSGWHEPPPRRRPAAGWVLGCVLVLASVVGHHLLCRVQLQHARRRPGGDAAPGAAGRGGRASGAGGGDTGGGPRARHRYTRHRRRVHAHAPLHVAAGRGALLRELSRGQPAGSRRAGTALAAPGAEHTVEAHRNRPRTLAGAALDGELSVGGGWR